MDHNLSHLQPKFTIHEHNCADIEMFENASETS
jgi:hypothetical protein